MRWCDARPDRLTVERVSIRARRTPRMKQVEVLGILGAGQMGSGIAQVAAQSGIAARLIDVNLEVAKRGIAGIEKQLRTRVARGKMQADEADAILGRISY